MFGDRLTYYESSNKIAGSAGAGWFAQKGTLKDLEIYGITSISDISYIKLTNVSIWKYGENNSKPILKGLALRVYEAE
jgi:hypothetical protein